MENLTIAELIDKINNSIDVDKSIELYENAIKEQIGFWFNNIINSKIEIEKTNDGFVTSRPNDIFNIIYSHIKIAEEKISKKYLEKCLEKIVTICFKELQNNQMKLSTDVEIMCAIINDSVIINQKCIELKNKYNYDILDEISDKYIKFANDTTKHLANLIFEDFNEIELTIDPIYFAEILINTMEDYFRDLSKWLNDEHFKKLKNEVNIIVNNKYSCVYNISIVRTFLHIKNENK